MRTNCTPMTKQRLAILAVGLGFGILFSPLIASSAHAYKDPADFVRQLGARATKISGDSDLSAEMKRQAYREVLRMHFDLDRISDVVLGRHRRTATAGERATFRRLFDVYLIATNARRLEGFAGLAPVGIQIDENRERIAQDALLKVLLCDHREGHFSRSFQC